MTHKMMKANLHSKSHSIDASYLLELQYLYENKFLALIQLEADLVSSVASLEIQLKMYKGDINNEKYLHNKNLIVNLASISDRFSNLVFYHEKAKYSIKNLRMENADLKQRAEILEKENLTLRKYQNV